LPLIFFKENKRITWWSISTLLRIANYHQRSLKRAISTETMFMLDAFLWKASNPSWSIHSRANVKLYFLEKKGDNMYRSIDMKSVLTGGLFVALILCIAGAVPFVTREDYDRFKIETNNSHAFILDSATGQVWSSKFYISSSLIAIGEDPSFHAPKTHHEDGIQ